MKKTIKIVFSTIVAILFSILLVMSAFAHSGRTDGSGGHRDNKNKSGLGSYHYHCGGYPAHLHKGGYCPYTDVFPSSVQIKASKTTLKKGESIDLTASVYPANSCNDSIYWSTSNSKVASVSSGHVVAKEYGTATITAESFNGKKKSIVITVKEITATKVTVLGLPEKEHFYIGDEFTLTSEITPDNVDNPKIVWSSSDKNIATVSKKGKVKLVDKGNVEIVAKASNGVVGKAIINVEEKYVEKVEISEEKIDLLLLEEKALTAVVAPSDATYPELTWSSEDSSVVSVSADGKITANGCGKTTVTATSTNGISDSVIVKVTEIKAESIKIDGPSSVFVGSDTNFTWTILPADTTVKKVQWSVSDESIAAIDENGVLTAKGEGNIIITAKQKDVFDETTIKIIPVDVEDIIITVDTEKQISKGDTVTFTAEVLPVNATYSDITWTVSNEDIAIIDENGVLNALNGGFVKVVATSGDGFIAEYSIFIYAPIFLIVVVLLLCVAGVTIGFTFYKKKKK